jgi:transposase
MGYSSYTIAVAVASQKTEDVIAGVVKGLHLLGALPKAIVPDNLKAAVITADRYDPKINERFLMMANHYGLSVLPARAGKPRDKAKVESAVNAFYRQVYSRIRNLRFESLTELNTTLESLTDQFNERLMQGQGVSRKLLFDRDEIPHMAALPAPFTLLSQLSLTVQKNYHVQIRSLNQYYSVPYTLAGQKVKVLVSDQLVSIYHNGQCVATHPISAADRKYTTVKEHMKSSHQYYMENQDVVQLRSKAAAIDQPVLDVIDRFLQRNDHPEQGLKSCQGILSLQRKYGAQALIWACKMAIETRCFTYRYIVKVAASPYAGEQLYPPQQGPLPTHSNIRGAGYYQ